MATAPMTRKERRALERQSRTGRGLPPPALRERIAAAVRQALTETYGPDAGRSSLAGCYVAKIVLQLTTGAVYELAATPDATDAAGVHAWLWRRHRDGREVVELWPVAGPVRWAWAADLAPGALPVADADCLAAAEARGLPTEAARITAMAKRALALTGWRR